jgi:hypothetical protein
MSLGFGHANFRTVFSRFQKRSRRATCRGRPAEKSRAARAHTPDPPQEILAELGVAALQRGTGFKELLDRAVQLVAEGLEAKLSKILEYMPEENRLLT